MRKSPLAEALAAAETLRRWVKAHGGVEVKVGTVCVSASFPEKPETTQGGIGFLLPMPEDEDC